MHKKSNLNSTHFLDEVFWLTPVVFCEVTDARFRLPPGFRSQNDSHCPMTTSLFVMASLACFVTCTPQIPWLDRRVTPVNLFVASTAGQALFLSNFSKKYWKKLLALDLWYLYREYPCARTVLWLMYNWAWLREMGADKGVSQGRCTPPPRLEAPPPPPRTRGSEWYASYWNVFLLSIVSAVRFLKFFSGFV